MKAVVALLVVLVAVAAAQHLSAEQMDAVRAESASLPVEKSYINEVEYVEALETEPHPSLVPHHFLEAEAERRGKGAAKAARKATRKARKTARKAARKTRKAARKAARKSRRAAKKASKVAKKQAKNMVKEFTHRIKVLTPLAAKGDKKAAKELKELRIKLKAEMAKLSGRAKALLKKKVAKAQKKAKKAMGKAKGAGKKNKKLSKKMKRAAKKAQKKLNKSAEKTNKKVRQAMDKLRHLSTSMNSLKTLMTRINKQVNGLIPENVIRKYAMEDPSKVSHSQMGKLKTKESKLVNPYNKNQNNEASYSNKIIPQGTKVITKPDDMAVQELAIKQKTLSKFTHKLADKDDISLV